MAELSDRYFDERIETLPPDQLRKLQDHRLRWQFRRCWDGSAWYRARFEVAGLSPETFDGLSDLERLPLSTFYDIREVKHAVWRVSPVEWTPTRNQRSSFSRHRTDGDIQHEYDRLARANWAAVNWNVFEGWPPRHYAHNHELRRFWANWLAPDQRRRTYLLHDHTVGDFLAYECAERRGRHWTDDHFIAEVINPTSEQSVPDGRAGELVVTDLVREANPLIRYRTGLRRILTREQCACGRTSSLIWSVDQFRKATKNANS